MIDLVESVEPNAQYLIQLVFILVAHTAEGMPDLLRLLDQCLLIFLMQWRFLQLVKLRLQNSLQHMRDLFGPDSF